MKPKTDNTRNERQTDRRNRPLNEMAKAKGWTGWSEMLTAMLRGEVEIPEKPVKRERPEPCKPGTL